MNILKKIVIIIDVVLFAFLVKEAVYPQIFIPVFLLEWILLFGALILIGLNLYFVAYKK